MALPSDLLIFGPAVDARQPRDATHERLRLDEDGAVEAVEATHELHGLLDHGQLIRSHRHQVGLEGSDVGGLADRVDEEAGGDLSAEALSAGSLP